MNRIYLYSSVQLLSRVPATTIIFSLSALTCALTAKLVVVGLTTVGMW